jgi:hypothetical protein
MLRWFLFMRAGAEASPKLLQRVFPLPCFPNANYLSVQIIPIRVKL